MRLSHQGNTITMSRFMLERFQVWIYLAAILCGLLLGTVMGDAAAMFERPLWPVLGLLLFATFTQVPVIRLREAFRDRRFMGVALAGNFVAVPLVVWGLVWFLPPDPAIRLGVLLVLLVPCTDWFITFSHLAGGDTGRAIAVTPVNLLLQIALLPVYLWLFMGHSFIEILAAGPIATAFVTLILIPLAAAWALEWWSMRHPAGAAVIDRLGWAPVPLLAVVVFLIAASQVENVLGALPVLGGVAGVFIAYLAAALLLGLALSRLFSLPDRSARVLIFALGTRNSFVVLPLALALSSQWAVVAVVIVFQSVVELFGVIVYLKLLPAIVPWFLARRPG